MRGLLLLYYGEGEVWGDLGQVFAGVCLSVCFWGMDQGHGHTQEAWIDDEFCRIRVA